jgi:transcription antitermination factor NusG
MNTATSHSVDTCAFEAALTEFPWYALRVRYQSEGLTRERLCGKGYPTFAPMYRTRRQWADRVKQIEVPLFPGYVFCRFDVRDWMPVRTTPGVVSVVSVGDAPAVVDEREIEAIRATLKGGNAAEPWPFLRAGQRVRVTSGSMRGHEGILQIIKNRCKLVLSISLLQRSVAVEVDRDCIEPVL